MNIRLRLKCGFAGALLLLLSIGLISQHRLKLSMDTAASVTKTYQILTELQGLSSAVHMAQRDERGYLLTGDAKLEARFHDCQARAIARFASLRSLAADHEWQQRRLDRLQLFLDRLFAVEGSGILSARNGREKAIAGYALAAGDDERTVRQIEVCLREIRNEEQASLQRCSRSLRDSSSMAAILVGAGSFLGAVLIAFSALWINRDLRRREQAETSLRQVQEGLEMCIEERTADLRKTAACLEGEVAGHRETEGQLRQSEQRYRLLFEDSPLAMEVFDPETLTFLAVNKAAEELYGYSGKEFLHMTLMDLQSPDGVPDMAGFLKTVKSADPHSNIFVTQHKAGKSMTIEAKVRSIEFDGQQARLALLTDITENKRLELQLRQSQKIEAVGRLAGGIAHDFNNLLTVILGYSDSILRKTSDADPLHGKVSEIQAAAQRAANLTRQLLAFSRKQVLQPQILEPNAVVSNISQMLHRLLGDDIQISLHLDAGIGQIEADPAQLEQVLVNLAVNARDAMPHGGRLVIESHNIELDDRVAALQGVPPGRYVMLAVSDTGCGMDEQMKTRVFEPFFTTKEIGKGTGLGLSMVLGVVQQSGGTVTIYSEPGIGTTFKIYLPSLDTPVEQSVEGNRSHSSQASGESGATILLVEDEPSLRALAREILREAGYVVFEAGNGKEGLRVANNLAFRPALLLTDVVMPEMSGFEMAEELQRKWPGLAVIYTSGYTDHALLERKTLRQDMPFLPKPYMPGALLERVAAVLESSAVPI